MRIIILLSSLFFATSVLAATPKKLEVEVKPPLINIARIQAEINDLSGQIASIEGQIVEADQRARALAFKVQRNKFDEGLMNGARAEVLSLEGDKSALMAQRQQLELDLALRR